MENLVNEFKTICDNQSTLSVTALQHLERYLREVYAQENSENIQNLFNLVVKTEQVCGKLEKLEEFYEKLKVLDERVKKLEK